MHRTLKAETAKPPANTLRAQQRVFDRFQFEFNEERPHEALDFGTPAAHYSPSTRPYPNCLRAPESTDGHEVRQARKNGIVNLNGHEVYCGRNLEDELLGIIEIADGVWRVDFYNHIIGTFQLANHQHIRVV